MWFLLFRKFNGIYLKEKKNGSLQNIVGILVLAVNNKIVAIEVPIVIICTIVRKIDNYKLVIFLVCFQENSSKPIYFKGIKLKKEHPSLL